MTCQAKNVALSNIEPDPSRHIASLGHNALIAAG